MSLNFLPNLSVCAHLALDFSTAMSENCLHFQKVFAIKKCECQALALVFFNFLF